MVTYELHHRVSRLTGSAILAAATCLSVYLYIRPALNSNTRKPPSDAILRVQAQASTASESEEYEELPYPPDAFPGGRDVETAYGNIKVFEWGPENGEKVLLIHGIGTPCLALGDMAWEFVRKGYRVMMFDLFGRGYSDAPSDLVYDERLYTTQILLVLASSPLPWTGSSAFHLLGYSLGGALAAAFAAYHVHLLRSLTLVSPAGLIRPSHIGWKSRLLHSEGYFPEWLLMRLARNRLEPRRGASADVPMIEDADIDFDEVPISAGNPTNVTIGDVVKWQLDANDGFVLSYVSTIRNAPVYGEHEGIWKLLNKQLSDQRSQKDSSGVGKICLILGEQDPIMVTEECIEDSERVLGQEGVEAHVLEGGHEIAISKGREVANVAISSWEKKQKSSVKLVQPKKKKSAKPKQSQAKVDK